MSVREFIDYSWMALGIFWIGMSIFTKPVARVQSSSERALHMVVALSGFVLLLDLSWHMGLLDEQLYPVSLAVAYFGCAVTVFGILFAIWARLYLGRNWSASVTVKQDHTLIRGGPYSMVRHPIYSGLLLAALGSAIAFARIRCFLGVLVLTAAFRFKSLVEERFMQEQFGAQYASYKHDVKALVPFIW
jgi:protein-S-isoprenylcysteine O-methyltransferase